MCPPWMREVIVMSEERLKIRALHSLFQPTKGLGKSLRVFTFCSYRTRGLCALSHPEWMTLSLRLASKHRASVCGRGLEGRLGRWNWFINNSEMWAVLFLKAPEEPLLQPFSFPLLSPWPPNAELLSHIFCWLVSSQAGWGNRLWTPSADYQVVFLKRLSTPHTKRMLVFPLRWLFKLRHINKHNIFAL